MNYAEKLYQIRVSRKLNKSEMAKIIGISQQTYSNIELGNTKKVDPKIVEWVTKNFVDNTKIELNNRNETHENKVTNSVTNADLSMQAIADLTYSGRVQADSVKIQAENNSRLIALLEEKERKGQVIVHGDEETHEGDPSKFEGLLVWLSSIAAGKKYLSQEEAFAEISRVFYGNHKHKSKRGTQAG